MYYESLTAIAQRIKEKEVSPVEVTEALLRRIEQIDVHLLSYATVTADLALDQAKQAERELSRGNYLGPLHGVPIAVKDLCYTAGIPTKGGLKVREDFVPDFDSTVVKRLADGGAVLLGKLNLTEGALSAYNPEFPIPVNPWDSSLWSGVSSSGTGVAVAAGLCFAAIGTDTGGSIRYPSMANGVVGLKPTWGRVSRHGVLALAESLDHVGPMARTVEDVARFFTVIAGKDDNDSTSLPEDIPNLSACLSEDLSDVRIGLDEKYLCTGTDEGLVKAIYSSIEVLKNLGAEFVPISMPSEGPMDYRNLWLPLTGYEAFQAHREFFPSRADEYGGYLRSVLEMGRTISESDYEEARQKRTAFNAKFVAELNKVDAVICPSGGMVFQTEQAPQYGDFEDMKAVVKHFQGQFTIPADLAGTPTLSVPCGFNENGWPYCLQLLGSRLGESVLCRIGHAFQKATTWHEHHPPQWQ